MIVSGGYKAPPQVLHLTQDTHPATQHNKTGSQHSEHVIQHKYRRGVSRVSIIVTEEGEEDEAGARVTSLELWRSGALSGGRRGGAHTARRVPGGVCVLPLTPE